ncbi:MAG: D-2-hydroxyacid dehydrogenase [Bacteroidetes bacterium]|nr:D-2-hydroxyacid dehydrogenase [Bacteroidota bacterium]
MKIVVLDGYTLNPGDLSWEHLERLGNCTVYERTSPDQVVERCHDAEIVLTNKVVLDENVINQLPKLEYIGVMATGVNVIDVAYKKKKGITVTNAAGYSSIGVAQHTLALILASINKVESHHNWARENWSKHHDFSYTLNSISELNGKTLGLIGFGQIAQEVAKIAFAFGMKILVYRRQNNVEMPEGITQVELDELLSRADVVSLHCPLTPETNQMVNAKFLSKMKPSAGLVNTARGGLVNEHALAKTLNNNEIAWAALDVLAQEPPSDECPLLSAENCLITPHIAWASKESRMRLMDIITENIRSYFLGEPQNVVS